LERDAMLAAKREPRLSQDWFDAVNGAVGELDAAVGQVGGDAQASRLVATLRQVVANAEAQIAGSEQVFAQLADLGDRSENLKTSIMEMNRLEERLQGIIETCSTLVRRLRPEGPEQ
jgi:methyl-accepting chemotaxis protein